MKQVQRLEQHANNTTNSNNSNTSLPLSPPRCCTVPGHSTCTHHHPLTLYIPLLATLDVGPLRGTEVGLKARRSCKFFGKFGFLYPGRRSPSGIHAGCGFNPPKIFIFAGLNGLLSNNCCSSFNCFASINSFAGMFANGSVDILMHLSSSA